MKYLVVLAALLAVAYAAIEQPSVKSVDTDLLAEESQEQPVHSRQKRFIDLKGALLSKKSHLINKKVNLINSAVYQLKSKAYVL